MGYQHQGLAPVPQSKTLSPILKIYLSHYVATPSRRNGASRSALSLDSQPLEQGLALRLDIGRKRLWVRCLR